MISGTSRTRLAWALSALLQLLYLPIWQGSCEVAAGATGAGFDWDQSCCCSAAPGKSGAAALAAPRSCCDAGRPDEGDRPEGSGKPCGCNQKAPPIPERAPLVEGPSPGRDVTFQGVAVLRSQPRWLAPTRPPLAAPPRAGPSLHERLSVYLI